MPGLENIQTTFCNDGESVRVLGKKLSPGDVEALNKAADLLQSISSMTERTRQINPGSAKGLGALAASGSELFLAYTTPSQPGQPRLF